MKYISTRESSLKLDFADVILSSLASDGGLYVPESYPHFSPSQISSMIGLSYCELAFEILLPFIGDSINHKDFKNIIEDSYSSFDTKSITPLTKINDQKFILELFHGPTFAFKDIALQFMGKLFDYVLEKRNENIVIIGATSGDTGSAAIEGCYKSKRVKMFVMHPHKRISEVQRRQMTTIDSDNVFNLAIDGTFDNCQDIMKELFANQSFLSGKTKLVAVNSINWCRIMAQIVYYFYAALNLNNLPNSINFSVPTGNFGNILAGYIAYQMGLPINKLIAASNSNDIIHRFISNNDYSLKEVVQTIAPSMDIQKASNFERLLFDINKRDSSKTKPQMENLSSHGIILKNSQHHEIKSIFDSASIDNETICKIINKTFNETGVLIDPHTATAVHAADNCAGSGNIPTIILSTAHPAKFPQAIKKSGISLISTPKKLEDVMQKKEKFTLFSNKNIQDIQEFILDNI